MKIYLIDQNKVLCDIWKEHFEGCENVEVVCGDYFSVKTDAIVSPANSFGYMDGGLDLAIRNKYGQILEDRIKYTILYYFYGELHVGQAVHFPIPTEEEGRGTTIIYAPTMRQPEDVSNTLNAYLAMRAILRCCRDKIYDSVAIPGLCAGIGKMPLSKVSFQMKMAYDSMVIRKDPKPIAQLHKEHRDLKAGFNQSPWTYLDKE